MNTRTKYYFIVKSMIIQIVFIIGIGFITRTLERLFDYNDYLYVLDDILAIARGFMIFGIIAEGVMLIYFIYAYYISKFYSHYHISVFEAMFYGFMDIHQLYDRIVSSNQIKEVQVDFKRSIISFKTNSHNYSLAYQDLFGVFNGRIESEFWSKLSKPKTQYNQKTYTKQEKFSNPYKVNQDYINGLKKEKEEEYLNFIVLSGFYKMNNKSSNIIAPHEVVDLIKN